MLRLSLAWLAMMQVMMLAWPGYLRHDGIPRDALETLDWAIVLMNWASRRDTAADGTLVYSFVEELKTRVPYYLIRLLGGTLYLSGIWIMAWNVWKTVSGAKAVNPAIPPDTAHAVGAPATA
ncbi:putative integral membrane protein [Achromobacter xylosoxidans NBRC 15126 = ATCC 27061]|nr:putative integral membrane protein [Achromobacter xylosoxidans NBRC 15126 = ATCC 27061]